MYFPHDDAAIYRKEARLTVDTLLEGISIGASAGLISGLILGLLHWQKGVIQRSRERREQIQHLAKTLEQTRDLIYSTSDVDLTDHPIGRKIPRDEVRQAQLQWLYKQIQQMLLGRSSRLSFDEIQAVKSVFNTVELHPNWVPNDNGYYGIFTQLESLEWLRMNQRR